ncbi:lipocalin [Cryomorpha ignava]|uniref:Outer membrane lipoprotein Blc n=1 Tax=Cryomorpha ignava TaxID=101383 RepID=A0A7K3WKW1_9FLAO|nr:lipocalin family protein [Cryomorpha ignava]NEN22286.1 lipocalin [Cryomorpha ignava]
MERETTRNLIGSALLAVGGYLLFKSGNALPKKLAVIKPFDKEKFLGKWYEIARLDHPFEKNLTNVTATYSKKSNGKIEVVNRGYNEFEFNWKEADGKAKFKDDENRGALKVSFFGPFYAGYNVIEVDEDYNHMLVAGDNLDYLWILSRKTDIPGKVKDNFLSKAKKLGYKTSRLIWVEHNQD